MTPDTLRTLDLLPCPFCGDTLVKSIAYAGQQDHPEDPTWWAGCTKCDAGVDAVGERAAITAWNTRAHLDAAWLPIWQAPYQVAVEVRVGRMTFLAMLMPDASMTDAGASCDQWQAVHEAEHPPCWSGGACWASNEDGVRSLQPIAFRHLPHPPAGEGGRG